jgi:hypothetical protein
VTNTVDYSLDINDSNADILGEEQDDLTKKTSSTNGQQVMFQRKKLSASNQKSAKRQSAKQSNPQKSVDNLGDQEGDEEINDRTDELATLNTGGIVNEQKYYSMVEDNTPSVNHRDASLVMMNMASIDSNSEFTNVSVSASNTLNNKKNRILKRVAQTGG